MSKEATFFADYMYARWPSKKLHLIAYRYYIAQTHFSENAEYRGSKAIGALVNDEVINVGSIVREFKFWRTHYNKMLPNPRRALKQMGMLQKSLKELDLLLVVYSITPSTQPYFSTHIHDNNKSHDTLMEFLSTSIPDAHPNVTSWEVIHIAR
jgi:hypothetical protein